MPWYGYTLIGAALVALLTLISPILLPFVVALVVGYLVSPLVEKMVKRGLNRTMASLIPVVLVVATFVGVLGGTVPFVVKDVSGFVQKTPAYLTQFEQQVLPQITAVIEQDFGVVINQELILSYVQKYSDQLASTALNILQNAALSTMALFDLASLLLVTPLVAFYFLRDWPKIVAGIKNAIPKANRKNVEATMAQMDNRLSAFIRGQTMVCLALGAFYGGALMLANVQMGLLIGFATGLLSFIPFAGMALGLVITAVVAMLQFQFDSATPYLIIAAIFAAGQILESAVFSPKFIGDSTGLHPVWIIFAVMAGSEIAGFTGMLIALPLATVMTVLVPQAMLAWHRLAK